MKFLKWLVSPVVIGTIGLLILSALVWWAFPLVAFGSARPFDGLWPRVITLAVIWLLWIGWLVFGAIRRRRTHAALVKGIAGGPTASQREAQVLAQRFEEAMAKLRASGGRSLFKPGSYLYELPWYVFIGAPGSGKTTALLNSGQQFLLSDEKGGAAVAGVGGTRNCDWWFTRDAVLIDTAGRYATQDSDTAVDAGAWDAFLALLKKTRPRQPINGVLLTVNAFDLMQQSATDRGELARSMRDRLHELQGKLGVRAPVYVLVTKLDLVAGFNETFGELPREQREQVWGYTLEHRDDDDADVAAEFERGFAGLEQRLGAGLRDRLQAERDPARRAAIFGFPQELAGLRRPLREFVSAVFAAGGAVQRTPPMRGFYLTSGTQEGTPIDRVMGSLGRAFGLERQALSSRAAGPGKSFFLTRLLRDVVFLERGLGVYNAAAERRRRATRVAVMASIGVVSLALIAGWGVSFVRNVNYADAVAAKLPLVKQGVDAIPPGTGGDIAMLTKPLADVRSVAQSAEFDVKDPPLLMTLGLYQGDKLDAGAQLAYQRLIERAFAPRIVTRLEERLRAANNANLENAYEALKSYLMLYTPDKFEPETLRAWIGTDWDTQYARIEPEARAEMDRHLDALLSRGAPPPLVAQDAQLVASMREMLVALPLEQRIYSRIKRTSRGNDLPDFTVAGSAGPRAAQVYRRLSGEPLTKGIAGLYTREGYRRTFQGTIPQLTARLASEETWVLGIRNDPARVKQLALGNEVADRVRRLYLEDYIKVWDRYLDDVKLVPLTTLAQQIEVFRILAGVDSPLLAFTRRVAEETTLTAAPAKPSAIGAVAQATEQAKKAREEAKALADPGAAPAVTGGGPLERMVDDHFKAYRRLVTGTPSPLDELRKVLDEQQLYLVAVDNAQKTKSPPPPGGGAAAKLKTVPDLPAPMRTMMESLADAGAKQSQTVERDVLSAELKPISDFCQRAVANRYPFAAGSRADVLPEDFGQIFAPGGMLDDFFNRRLVAMVDTGSATWAFKPLPDGTRPSSGSLPEFQRAARIREAFFRSGGKTPSFRIDVRALELGDGLKEVDIDIDGQVYKLLPGGAPATITWPSQRVASQVKLTTVPAGTTQVFDGPWGLFRMFDRFEVVPSAQPERFGLNMNLDGRRARLEVVSTSVLNPFKLREMQQFRCPSGV